MLTTLVVETVGAVGASLECDDTRMNSHGCMAHTSGLVLATLSVKRSAHRWSLSKSTTHTGPCFTQHQISWPKLSTASSHSNSQSTRQHLVFIARRCTAAHDSATGTLKGPLATSMSGLKAAQSVSEGLEDLEVTTHRRAVQYSKTGAVFTFLLDRMDALVPVTSNINARDATSDLQNRMQ